MTRYAPLFLGLISVSWCTGCNQGDSTSPASSGSSAPISMDVPPPTTVDIHSHPTEGPHHGSLIELGKEEFHAELVHDDKSLEIYILDSSAKVLVPIDAPEVVINLLREGKPEQFRLTSSADSTDPSGKSSRFVSQDQELIALIDQESSSPKLSVTINGKTYRGLISHDHAGHDHDHAGHDHDH